jgi:protein-L-isoaspartate(D-aspartate) O-methyltransferase
MSKLMLITWLLCITLFQSDSYLDAREKMVKEQIIARGITNPSIIEAFEKVPRHLFVPGDLEKFAYDDRPLSIGFGQTISQPYVVAFMTNILVLKPSEKVLEIGTGSGYQAAILAQLVKQVFTVEIVEPLGTDAQIRLQHLGYKNIEVKIGDGYNGWPDHAPFDAIIVTAAAETIPPPLINQLAEGGRMIIPVGSQHASQELVMVEKKEGKIKKRDVLPVRFVPFTRSK